MHHWRQIEFALLDPSNLGSSINPISWITNLNIHQVPHDGHRLPSSPIMQIIGLSDFCAHYKLPNAPVLSVPKSHGSTTCGKIPLCSVDLQHGWPSGMPMAHVSIATSRVDTHIPKEHPNPYLDLPIKRTSKMVINKIFLSRIPLNYIFFAWDMLRLLKFSSTTFKEKNTQRGVPSWKTKHVAHPPGFTDLPVTLCGNTL